MSDKRLKKGEQYLPAISKRLGVDGDLLLAALTVDKKRRPGNVWIVNKAESELLAPALLRPAETDLGDTTPPATSPPVTPLVHTGKTLSQPPMRNSHLILVQPDAALDVEAEVLPEPIFVWVRDNSKFLAGMKVEYFYNGDRWQFMGREPRYRGRY